MTSVSFSLAEQWISSDGFSYFLQALFEVVSPSGHSFSFKLLESCAGSKSLDRSFEYVLFVLPTDACGPSISLKSLVSLWRDWSNEFSIVLSTRNVIFLKDRSWIFIENQRLKFLGWDTSVLISLESLLPS